MVSFSEQVSRASLAVYEAQLISAQAFVEAAIAGGARVVDLNLDAARTTLAAATVVNNQLLSAKDPQELLQLSRAQSQLAIDRIGSYGRQAKDVAHETHENFSAVTKGEFAAAHQKFGELLQAVKEAPLPLVIPFNNFLKTPFSKPDEGYDKNKNRHAGN
ncbi:MULTISPECIES: TIGR01841 family phasin [unclassified Janthinobacterium]|uniref:TIGR01841 family phasin n=1 Tax=unclassified Janthinobacterium TaxID=2610881 RepID=UPI00161E0236|nr:MULTISPECIES: TIGR01841 family phasin [unclassified Janthinobacterium]MBB5370214.1 phasin family protein [Janthinobacterium sp. K2C7]MBB5383020.1 phasin family protein [Janthinobacterium sp. K2Li3]MBB5388501.1 phasin family protein [Janthinobacterium sp. K2E3]